jgi:hypothetical protein
MLNRRSPEGVRCVDMSGSTKRVLTGWLEINEATVALEERPSTSPGAKLLERPIIEPATTLLSFCSPANPELPRATPQCWAIELGFSYSPLSRKQ